MNVRQEFLTAALAAGVMALPAAALAQGEPAPPKVQWCTFLGGPQDELVSGPHGFNMEARGMIVTGGSTGSSAFPVSADAYDASYNGGECDGYVALLDPGEDGDRELVYCSLIGGSGFDEVRSVSFLDGMGLLLVAGWTSSPDFPTTPNALDTTYNGGETDGFFSVLYIDDVPEYQLVYSTFLGGAGLDWVNDMIPAQDTLVLAGGTASPDFPVTPGAFDTTHNGARDGWVGMLVMYPEDNGDVELAFSTYLGGGGDDWVTHMAPGYSNTVTVSGRTASPDFPTTEGAYDRTYNGGYYDAFAARLDWPLETLICSTFLGGSGVDANKAMVIDDDGLVLAGWTHSPDFPTTPGAYDETYNGSWDAYLTRLDPAMCELVQSTYLGGGGAEGINDLVIDVLGGISFAASADADDFPTTPDAAQPDHAGGAWDAVLGRIDASLHDLRYASFAGGSGDDYSYVSFAAGGEDALVMMAGVTDSADFPTTTHAYDTTFNGGDDAFLALYDLCPLDYDGDLNVGIVDLLQLLTVWGRSDVPEDYDGDGNVGITDFLALLAAWGECR